LQIVKNNNSQPKAQLIYHNFKHYHDDQLDMTADNQDLLAIIYYRTETDNGI